ncbi:type IV pilin protein [Photobacterium ganghwense]|uniref:type IV pilin protein n=1 Tax=Photobacterium ganghwense TaxID=320778 RepID=UPI00405653D0
MKKQNGVTLIELLIAVTIMGIISALAYPAYTGHVLKGYRSQAIADLLKIQLELEENYNINGSYNYSIVQSGTCSFCQSNPLRYQLSIDSSGTGMNKYIIKAVPQNNQGQDKDNCKTLKLNAAGIGSSTGTGTCW